MSTRLIRFRDLQYHPYLGRLWRKLSKTEIQACEAFIVSHAALDDGEFTKAVNRWHVDDPKRPKRHADMWALVSQCVEFKPVNRRLMPERGRSK